MLNGVTTPTSSAAASVKGLRADPAGQAPSTALFAMAPVSGAASGTPSTVVPVGTSADGLPIGVQIVGPYLHDRTTLHLAKHVESLVQDRDGGPIRPPLAL